MINIFENHNIIEKGHFLLTSGMHSDTYIHKDRIWRHPLVSDVVVRSLANKAEALNNDMKFHTVVGPPMAGIPFAACVAYELFKKFAYPEMANIAGYKIFRFRRGFGDSIKDKNVLIIEDIMTTGQSSLQVVDAIKAYGGNPKAVLCIWNRNPELTQLFHSTVPVYSLIAQEVPSWPPPTCPLCADGVPLTNPKTGETIT